MRQCGSKLSVIVPVFNGEKYIARCLDSLINGEVYEIIVVDDCSADRSRNICEQYADRFRNIFLLCNDQNKGVTYSRYVGLHHATGEYVTFVDADDWVEASFFEAAESLMEENHELDIVIGKMVRDDGKGKRKDIIDFSDEKYLNRQEAIDELFLWNCYRWEMWGKIYRKRLFAVWQPDFSVKVCEDLDCTWQVFQKVNKVLALPLDFYHYYFNEDSVTSAINYIDSNNYKVFEKILNTTMLSENVYRKAAKHYVLALINIIRTLILQGSEDEEILYYQNKGKYFLLEDRSGLCEEYMHVFESPDMTRGILSKIETEICGLIYKLLQEEVIEHPKDSVNKIYLYGTGVIAEVIGFLLEKNGHHDFEYVVSEDQFKKEYYKGKKVHYLNELECTDRIILALNIENQKNVMESIQKHGFLYAYGVNTYGIM